MNKFYLQSSKTVGGLFKFSLICMAVFSGAWSSQAAIMWVTKDTTLTANYNGQIRILLPNVTLNLNGKSVNAGGAAWAIYDSGQNGVLILSNGNGSVSNATNAIRIVDCKNVQVYKVNTIGNQKGIKMSNGTNCLISYGTHRGINWHAISIEGGTNNKAQLCSGMGSLAAGFSQELGSYHTFYNCSAYLNNIGFRMLSPWFTVEGCRAESHTGAGFVVFWASNGILKNSSAYTSVIGFDNCDETGGTGVQFLDNPTGLTAINNSNLNYHNIPCYDIACQTPPIP